MVMGTVAEAAGTDEKDPIIGMIAAVIAKAVAVGVEAESVIVGEANSPPTTGISMSVKTTTPTPTTIHTTIVAAEVLIATTGTDGTDGTGQTGAMDGKEGVMEEVWEGTERKQEVSKVGGGVVAVGEEAEVAMVGMAEGATVQATQARLKPEVCALERTCPFPRTQTLNYISLSRFCVRSA